MPMSNGAVRVTVAVPVSPTCRLGCESVRPESIETGGVGGAALLIVIVPVSGTPSSVAAQVAVACPACGSVVSTILTLLQRGLDRPQRRPVLDHPARKPKHP